MKCVKAPLNKIRAHWLRKTVLASIKPLSVIIFVSSKPAIKSSKDQYFKHIKRGLKIYELVGMTFGEFLRKFLVEIAKLKPCEMKCVKALLNKL